MTKMMKNKDKKNPFCLIYTLLVIVVANVFAFTHFWIDKIGTPFASMAIFIFITIAFLMGFIWALIHLIFTIKFKKYQYSFLPIVLNLLLIILIFTVPYSKIYRNVIFHSDLEGYSEIVNMIESGELYSQDNYWDLPSGYSHLSSSDKILVEQNDETLFVMFFIYSGIVEGAGGYVYSSTDTCPSIYSLGYDVKTTEKKKDNWYWVELY